MESSQSTGTAKDFIKILTPELKGEKLAGDILGSLLDSALSAAEKSNITLNLAKQLKPFVDSIESSANSQTDSMGANSSANTAMNISNETSITARNVQYSNPYALAKLLKDSKLAALGSDGTYSDSKIKDGGSTSKSDNFQLGFYASYKFAPT